jgi:glyoxylase-like metal-dependent hydrolase (beta-lactamase superfamily II)
MARLVEGRTMAGMISRRAVVRGLGAGLALAFAGRAAPAQPPAIPSWPTGLRELAPGVWAYVQAGGPAIPYSGISNAGILVGPDSLTAVDSLPAPLQARAFLDATARALPGKPIQRLIYTHHHGDHIDGAVQFPHGIEIVATEFASQAIKQMAPLPPWAARAGWAAGGESHARLPPTTVITGPLTYFLGDLEVRLMPVVAHSMGDLLVHVPQHKLMFLGDNGFFYVAPYVHWGYLGRWIELCEQLLDMDVKTFAPGHGPVAGKELLAEQRDYLVLYRKEARARFDAGMSPGAAAASITTMGRFDAWRGARDRLAMNIARTFQEFAGTLTPQMDEAATAAAMAEYARLTGYVPER